MRYQVASSPRWGLCIEDTQKMVYRYRDESVPKKVAAHIFGRELAVQICDLLNEAEAKEVVDAEKSKP